MKLLQLFSGFLLIVVYSTWGYADSTSSGFLPSKVTAPTQVKANVLHLANYNTTGPSTYCSSSGTTPFAAGRAHDLRFYYIVNNTATMFSQFPGYYAFVYSCEETFWTSDPNYQALANNAWVQQGGAANPYCSGNPSTTEFCSIKNSKAPIISFYLNPPGIMASVQSQWLVFPLPNNPNAQYRLRASGTWNPLWQADYPIQWNPPAANFAVFVDFWPLTLQTRVYDSGFVGQFNNGWGGLTNAVEFGYFVPSIDNSGIQRNLKFDTSPLTTSANIFEKTCSLMYNTQAFWDGSLGLYTAPVTWVCN